MNALLQPPSLPLRFTPRKPAHLCLGGTGNLPVVVGGPPATSSSRHSAGQVARQFGRVARSTQSQSCPRCRSQHVRITRAAVECDEEISCPDCGYFVPGL